MATNDPATLFAELHRGFTDSDSSESNYLADWVQTIRENETYDAHGATLPEASLDRLDASLAELIAVANLMRAELAERRAGVEVAHAG